MRITRTFILLFLLISLMSLVIPVLPPIPYDYETLNLPAHFTADGWPIPSVTYWENTPANNAITNDGATLGRVLFYDKSLSANGTTSCASCHKQTYAFADSVAHSAGFNGGLTRRNSMTLVNTRWYFGGRMFWDTRASSLENQVLMPFTDTVEMGNTLPAILQTIRQHPYYAQLFQNAFGDTSVTTSRISLALAQFIRSIVSDSSKYDIGRASVTSIFDPFPNFSTSENIGKNIFFNTFQNGGGDCFMCHKTEAFVNDASGPSCNGLDAVSTTDKGMFESTGNNGDIGKFKVTSLRNIALTAPYMHDGRFADLNQVVAFYNSGIQLHMNLSPGLIDTTGGVSSPRVMNLAQQQIYGLIDFLKTLTDSSLINEVKWSDPFSLSTSTSNNIDLNQAISLFPNPASDHFSIAGTKELDNRIADLTLFDSHGKIVLSKKTILSSGQQIYIDKLNDGLYFVRIQIGDFVSVSKLSKLNQ